MEKEKILVKMISKERTAIEVKNTPMKTGWYSLFDVFIKIIIFLIYSSQML
jgi:hypothetical protein